MNCDILSTLYIRANGEIVCYDDAGAQICLAHVQAGKIFSPSDAFNNSFYQHIREALQFGRAPWTDVCAKCAMLRPKEQFLDLLSQKKIKTLQVEPTLACSIKCPGCTHLLDIKQRRTPHKLTPEGFGALLSGLMKEGYAIDLIEYCGNGEPLNNPQFSDFVLVGREYYPQTPQRLVTNGNFDFSKSIGSVFIDEYMISCDGAMQGSYEQYRMGGDIEKVMNFMKDIPKFILGRRQKKIWKYILFEFNDSDEELLLAAKLKEKLDVDELVFVRTHSGYKSVRFSNPHQRPPVWGKGIRFDFTPLQRRSRVVYKSLTAMGPRFISMQLGLLMIDELSGNTKETLKLRGWLLSKSDVDMKIWSNGVLISEELELGIPRPDVGEAFPSYAKEDSGFELVWNSAHQSEIKLEVVISDSCGRSELFVYDFQNPQMVMEAS